MIGEAPVNFAAQSSILAVPGTFPAHRIVKVGGIAKKYPITSTGVVIYNAETGKIIRGFPVESPQAIVLSPDGKTLAVETYGGDFSGSESISSDSSWGILTLWDITTGKPLKRWRKYAFTLSAPIAFSPDGKIIATAGKAPTENADPVVQLWEARSGKPLGVLKEGSAGYEYESASGLAFSPDGTILAVRDSGTLVLWDIKTRKIKRTLNTTSQPRKMNDGSDSFTPIAFSSDGTMIATESAQSTIKVWRVKDGTMVKELSGHQGKILSLSFSGEGNVLGSSGSDGAANLWNAATGELLATLRILAQKVDRKGSVSTDWIAYTPQGFYEASPGASPYIRWRNGNTLHRAEAYEKRFRSAALVAKAMKGETVARELATPQYWLH